MLGRPWAGQAGVSSRYGRRRVVGPAGDWRFRNALPRYDLSMVPSLLRPATSTLLTTATNGEGNGEVERAWALFAVLAVLLVAFFIAVVLVTLMRWRRQREEQPTPKPREPEVDAWEESGRRAKPY
jgi:hypothetical protein